MYTRLYHFRLCYNLLLSRVSILTRDIDIANLSVCPSVRPSVCLSARNVPVSDDNGLPSVFFSLYGSPIILVLQASNIFTKFRQGSPQRGALNTGGVYKFRDFGPISRYISQRIQDSAKVKVKVTVLFNVSNSKWYKIELYLQWPTNRKSHVVYRTSPYSMTLNDP